MPAPDRRQETPPRERQIKTLLRDATNRLQSCLSHAPAGSADTPYLDSVTLLCHVMDIEKEALFALLGDELPDETIAGFHDAIEERCKGTPVSYIRGYKEFYGRNFAVDNRVLVPRPDSEILVETALGEIDRLVAGGRRDLAVHDCCTGSACIAITIAAERREVSVTASDISIEALSVARKNGAALLGHEMVMFVSNGLSGLLHGIANGSRARVDIVTANPPYLADTEVAAMAAAAWPEPRVALAGGSAGLSIISNIVSASPQCLTQSGALVLEHGANQAPAVQSLLVGAGFGEVWTVQDLGARDRVSVGRMVRGSV